PTIFANLVPRSLVSATTQTPRSGPFVAVTAPPMSWLSICRPGLGWAAGRAVGQANAVTTRPTSTAPEQINRDLSMSVYLAATAFGDIRDAMRLPDARTIRLNGGTVKPCHGRGADQPSSARCPVTRP